MKNGYDLDQIDTNCFTYRDVMEAYQIKDYQILKATIEDWMNLGSIKPNKNKGRTSFTPSIYCEYKKIIQKSDYSRYRSEISTLHTKLNISGYLMNPEKYVENAHEIKLFSDFLWNRPEALQQKMSVKERSYDIWGDEKLLESSIGKKLCSWNCLNYDFLNCFYAPESFFYIDLLEVNQQASTRKVTALILENKDSWYSLGKVLKNSINRMLLGKKIDLLIYGEGNKATKSGALRELMEDYVIGLPNSDYEMLYVGDIDIAGVMMLYGCINNNKQVEPEAEHQAILISPFLPLYQRMLQKLEDRCRNTDYKEDMLRYIATLNDTDDNRGRSYHQEFLALFNQEEKNIIKSILDLNKRIPQEVLSYSDYLLMVE